MNPNAVNNLHLLLPVIILVWLAFFVILGAWISSRVVKNTFQKRIQEALAGPTDDEMQDLIEEKKAEEMGKSFLQRSLGPILHKMGARMKGKANNAAGQQIRDMLEQAGHPLGMNYPEFMALKVLSLLTFIVIGIVSGPIVVNGFLKIMEVPSDPQMSMMGTLLWICMLAFIGFSGPGFWLRRTVNKRIKQIRKSMADVVDLIVLSIEAGLGFDMAVGEAVSKTTGPLSEELRRVLDEVRVGKPQGDAFRDMAERVKMSDMSLLVAAIDQASKTGIGLAQALRLQAQEIRERRMAFIKEQAGKLPVKMMLPLVLFIFPALFIVILGPAAVQIMQMSASGELKM
jgi:tight adherence protein C